MKAGKQKYMALEEQHKKTCDKLKFALGEIEILNKQLKKEKEIFHEAYVLIHFIGLLAFTTESYYSMLARPLVHPLLCYQLFS